MVSQSTRMWYVTQWRILAVRRYAASLRFNIANRISTEPASKARIFAGYFAVSDRNEIGHVRPVSIFRAFWYTRP
jgi:hypothetical protein